MGRFYISPTNIGRYTLVRIVSRGGDYLISTTLITLYGSDWFFPAVAFSSIFNISIDYLGQKFWAFKQKSEATKRRSTREIILYLFMRGLYAVPAFVALFIMYQILAIPYAISALLVTGSLWFISFEAFQGLFIGSTRHLPRTVRRTRIIILKKARSW
jgi:putative flippase GtrA